ncbi:35925_t:CDS:2 [Racocetra persica]|uniref:35925_t:CDS:1 n=1 Tax=Racocetra persica TaxID=160502 RepID=A0ACA9L5B0_9GLOM|nr:35925_t:CDS:2 [Racocetra persica]
MLDIRKFIIDVFQLGSFFQAGNIAQKFKNLSSRFDAYIASLNSAISKVIYKSVQNISKFENVDKAIEFELKSIKEDLAEIKKEQHKGTVTSIDLTPFLNSDNYKPKYDIEPIAVINDKQTEKEISEQVVILNELRISDYIRSFIE